MRPPGLTGSTGTVHPLKELASLGAKGCVFSQGWEVSFSPCEGVTSTWTLTVARDLPASHVEVVLARGCLNAESPAPGMVPGPSYYCFY